MPGCEYNDCQYIKVIADRLEAASASEVRRIIFNMPPRSMKSMCVSVAENMIRKINGGSLYFLHWWCIFHCDKERLVYRKKIRTYSKRSHLEVVKLLVEEGGNIRAIDNHGNKPMHHTFNFDFFNCSCIKGSLILPKNGNYSSHNIEIIKLTNKISSE